MTKYPKSQEDSAVKFAINYYRAIKAYMVLGSLADVLSSMVEELADYASPIVMPDDWFQLAQTLESDLLLMATTGRENGLMDEGFFTSLSKAKEAASYIVKMAAMQDKMPLSTANSYFALIRNSLTDALSRILPRVESPV